MKTSGSTRPPTVFRSAQSGYAILSIGIFVLVVMSLMGLALTKSGIIDIRTSADKVRYSEALAQAELAIETGYTWLSNSANRREAFKQWSAGENVAIGVRRWLGNNYYVSTTTGVTGTTQLTHTSGTASDGAVTWQYETTNSCTAVHATALTAYRCRPLTATLNDGTGARTANFVLATPIASPGTVYFLIATGTSADGTAQVVVKQGIGFGDGTFPGNNGGPAPMMGVGNIPLNGSFNLVPNPNGGGPGVPVSIWSKTLIDSPQGSAKSCHAEDFQSGCTASLSMKDFKGPDIVDNDTVNFPDDMFGYIFGVDTPNYNTVKQQATVLADCTSLGPNSTGLIWVTGDCVIPAGGTYGSRDKPIMMVVEGNEFRMNANSTYYGIVFAFDPTGAVPAGNMSMTMNGGATVYGSLMSNNTTNMGVNINGTFNMIYDVPSMNKIIVDGDGGYFKLMSKMPGSWSDYIL